MGIRTQNLPLTLTLALSATLVETATARQPEVAEDRVSSAEVVPDLLAEDVWTLAVLPDNATSAARFPGCFLAQTGWVVANKERWDIRFVVHAGEVAARDGTSAAWRNAGDAMGLLDGVVPYVLAPRSFPFFVRNGIPVHVEDPFEGPYGATMRTFGGAMGDDHLDDIYHLLDAGGSKWIVIVLGRSSQSALWAADVLRSHPDRTGILVLRAPRTGDENDAISDLIETFSIRLVLSGAGDGNGHRHVAVENDAGASTHYIHSDFGQRPLGGEAFLRLFVFRRDGTARVLSYSPLHDVFLTGPDQQLDIDVEPTPVAPPPYRIASTVARAQGRILLAAMANYRLNHNRRPPDLQTLTRPDPDNFNDVYIDEIPLDPWGSPYVYRVEEVDGRRVAVIVSLGQDGQPGGEGADADIVVGEGD